MKQLSFSFLWSKLNFSKINFTFQLSVNNDLFTKTPSNINIAVSIPFRSVIFFSRSNFSYFTRLSTSQFGNEIQPPKRILIAINLGFSKQNKTLKQQKYFGPRSPDCKWHKRFLSFLTSYETICFHLTISNKISFLTCNDFFATRAEKKLMQVSGSNAHDTWTPQYRLHQFGAFLT